MSARWGFDLDMSAVRLMRREGDQWQEVVRENIDGPDIEDRLMAMAGRVDEGEAVALFLPREQILYTDVKLTTEDRHLDEIVAALDGRTPYTLDELEYDWEMTGPDVARVAAIAKETLDEAAAFAEARGLAVAGYGALADTDDFPRHPSFGASLGPTEEAVVPPAPPRPEPARVSDDPSQPVLLVEDDKPVMEVRAAPMPPLDPGEPLAGIPQPPRVRTDIAAGTLSGAAATLTPPKGPAIRVRDSGSRPRHTLIAFAVAAVLTVGVAAIVWSILPLAPGRSDTETPTATQTGHATDDSAPSEDVVLAPELPEPSVVDAPPPLAQPAETAEAPALPRIGPDDISRKTAVSLPDQTADPGGLPATSQPYPKPPESFATILTEDPVQGLDGSEDVAETTLDIYFASIERADLAFDAIALPPPDALMPTGPPLIAPPPPLNPGPPGAKFVAANPRALPDTAPEPESVSEPEPGTATLPDETAPEPEAEPGLPTPTALASALPDRAPRARPTAFEQDIERQQFGGRTRAELARLTPPPRPASAQIIAQTDRASAEASDLAVASSLVPRVRPSDFDAIVAAAVIAARTTAPEPARDFETPDTRGAVAAALAEELEPEEEPGTRPQDTPRLVIPSNTSVARQATLDNAIRLNQINLVGVYGVPSDRRALIRLPSGRYVKVKVGDRVDGGTVAQINDSELIYRKGSRTLSLAMPKG